MKLAEQIQFAYENLSGESPDPFHLGKARLFTMTGDEIKTLGFYGDAYDGIDEVSHISTPLGKYDLLGVETCGWAAPMHPDVPFDGSPSEHPLRRRVRLVTGIDHNLEVASAMQFADETKDVEVMLGGSGALAEQLKMAMLIIMARAIFEMDNA